MSAALKVSDHALVRWMERTGLADLEPVREAIAESLDRAATGALALGVAEFLILADGLVYVVRNGVVVTVIPEDGRHRHVHLLLTTAKDNAEHA